MRIPDIVIDIIAFLLCCLGLMRIQMRPGLPITVVEKNDTVYCGGVTHEWFAQTVCGGEAILAVNGQAISHNDDLEFILDGCQIDSTVELRIAGFDGVRVEHSRLIHYYGTFYLISVIVVSTLFFAVGLVVRWKKPEDSAARVYHAGSIATAVQLCTTWGSYVTEPVFIGVLLRSVFATTYAFIPVTFIHLALLFPRPRRTIVAGLLPALYAIAFVLAAGSAVTFIRAWSTGLVEMFRAHLDWFSATRVFFIVLVFGGLWTYQRSYAGAGDESERRKLRWVIWGMFVGILPFVVLWVLPSMVFRHGFVPESVMLLASGVIPLAFGVSIVKYHILDIDPLLNRSLVYGTAMAFVVLIYIGIVGGLAMALSHATYGTSLALSTGAAIIVALLFEPMRRLVQRGVDRRFFRVQYDFRQAARKIQEDVKSCVSLDQLGQLIVERIEMLIPVERLGLYLADGPETMRCLSGRGIDAGDQHRIGTMRQQVERAGGLLSARGGMVEPGVNHREADAGLFNESGLALACPLLRADKQLLGMLLLGPRKAGTRFTSEDVDLLANIAAEGGTEMERILLQRALMEQGNETERLHRLNAMKSEFVSYVSHELRTPLTSIRMFAELLAGQLPHKETRMREYVGIISGESDRLHRMVDTILDSAKIDQGEQHYSMRPVRFDLIVKEVLRTMKYQLTKEKFRVTLEIARGRGRMAKTAFAITADPDAIREALLNLLTNAMKYSSDSRKIRVVLARTRDEISCSVEDQGRGIPPDAIPHLFEKFFRDRTLPNKIQGVGLGLSVVKHIMDAHDGRIDVRSTPGEGSVFTLVFPLAVGDKPRRRHNG